MRQLVVVPEIPPVVWARTAYAPILSFSPLPNQPAVPFSNAKTLLGQEFPFVIYDMRAEQGICLNVEALAIAAGTVQENGTLFLVCPMWDELATQIDLDSLRWNNAKAICTPHFYHYFKQLVGHFFPQFKISLELPAANRTDFVCFTEEQQAIFDQLPIDSAEIHLLTAARGRGKSTLSGKLAQKLAETHSVVITARSHSALPHFWKAIEGGNLPFFAPDKLIQLIDSAQISPHQWLFVDEAASLPLPMLHRFCAYFDNVVLTTTTHNYEGTGRGFSLKFLPQLTKRYRQWQLTQPLRWSKNDNLEQFIQQLLLLTEQEPVQISTEQTQFYQLLADAHYKTTPTDLRRLFDAEDQHFFQIKQEDQLIAGAWLVEEGGLSNELADAIWHGERRPQGSLVAQYLCFQGNLKQACQLRSQRISRIAVQPAFQQQGYGSQLMKQIIQHAEQSTALDFLSVSFGLNPELLKFWQACGFQLAQITSTIEASSGLHSAMMLYPISADGHCFVQQAIQQFNRDFSLLPFSKKLPWPMNAIQPDLNLNEQDRENLAGFAKKQRHLPACYASLYRLFKQKTLEMAEFAWLFDEQSAFPKLTKSQLAQLKQVVSSLL